MIARGRARRPALLLALAGGAAGPLVAACQPAPASAPAAVVASSSAPPAVAARPTPAAAVTMLAPVGAGAAAVASVIPSSSARGGVEVVAGHPVVAAALEPTLLGTPAASGAGRPAGEALGGVLLEGQAVQTEVALEAGCYTAIGLSPSLSILEVELAAGGQAARRARSSSGTASLGECAPLAAGPARLRLTAVSGAGPVVGRLFRR